MVGWRTAAWAIALVVVMSSGLASAASAEQPDLEIVAHRGDSSRAPENTLAAIGRAAQAGADTVEIDVRLTYDNVPVLMHDRRLERTTNGTGYLAQRAHSYVAGLDAGSWFSRKFAGEPVPTQYRAMKKAGELGLGMLIDLKGSNSVAETARIARRWAWLDAYDRAVAISFSATNLARLRAEDSRIRTGLITRAGVTLAPDEALAHGEVICIHSSVATADYVAGLHAAGLRVYAWTADTAEQWAALKAAGVDGVSTNTPAALAAWETAN